MKRFALCLFAFAYILGIAPAWGGAQKKADKATEQWRYEAEDINKISKQGTVTFKIWSYSKKETVAISQAPKNAVHAILDRKSTRLNSSHIATSRMPSSA